MSERSPNGFSLQVATVATVTLVAGVALGAATASAAEPTAPVLGQSETVTLVSGQASVRPKGSASFTPLTGAITVADESEVDAGHGRVAVTVATLQPGQTATATAYQGRFLLHQDALAPAQAHLVLSQPLTGCGAPRLPRKAGRAQVVAAARRRRVKTRRLWVSETGGSWGTGGRYVSTAVEGTRWLTLDECHRSAVKVVEGVVVVHDLINNASVSVAAGHEYVAIEESPALMPPEGQVYTGVSGGSSSTFAHQVGKHVAVFGYFATWYQPMGAPLSYARGNHARLFLHLSTDRGYGGGAGEVISPGGIAQGGGDDYLISLGRELASSNQPVYIALLPEMNQTNNAYSAFTPSGAPRDGSHSTSVFRQAFRRCVLILRGGSLSAINRRLHLLQLPPARTSQTTLPTPRVAFMWAPQTAGTPDIPANGPAPYYPGSAYVDIVGTDFYSAFPNFTGLSRLYASYPTKPFGFNEWAMWQSGDPGFVTQLFSFIRSHRRVGIMVYNQGLNESGPFRLYRFPAAAAEIRRQTASSRFLSYTPEWMSGGSH